MEIQELHGHFLNSSGVSTDTRNITPDSIFFALKGERFNGNEYALQAIEAGASYAVVDEPIDAQNSRLIQTENVLKALQDLAAFHRAYLEIPIIGITGSNGKTTTKELMRDILRKKFELHATRGNLNNHIGVPLTLLELTDKHELAIIEMGANHVGEIAELCSIADPDLGLITNIGRAHIGEFGGAENIIKAKSELLVHLREKEGLAFVLGSSDVLMKKSEGLERIIYGDHEESQTFCNLSSADPFLQVGWKDHQVKSNLIGDYNLDNICAAIALGDFFQVPPVDIVAAIQDYDPDNNRSQMIERGGKRIILDAYNANPDSMEAALRNLSQMNAGSKLAILGDMLELGDESSASHRDIIALADELGIDSIYVGPEFCAVQGEKGRFYSHTDEAAHSFSEEPIQAELILIKGSRGIKLEDLVEKI